MRKFPTLVLLLSLLPVSNAATYAQSRARRVGQSAPPATTPAPAQRSPAPAARPAPRAPDDVRQRDVNEEVGEDELVSVNTTLVTIPVSIMDRDGRFIPDLRKEDFRIFEDGVEQEVAYFAEVEKPFTVALVLDTSGSTQFKLEDIQDAAIAFVQQLRPEDRVLVVSFDDDIRFLAEATSDRRLLTSAIRRTRTGGGTKLYDAVDRVIKQRLERIEGRKAIVLFTDGVDTTSKRASYASNVRDAEELDALIYPVQYDTYTDQRGSGGGGGWPGAGSRLPDIFGLPFPFPIPGGGGRRGGGGGGGPGTSREDYRTAERYLREMAERTGGRLYRADNLRYLEQAFSDVAEELRRQYSLGYYPQKQTQASERRQLKVRVKRPNLVVRARDSYIYKPSGATTTTAQEDNGGRRPTPPELRRPRPFTRTEERAMKR
jgi:VWFA-related protein